MRRLFRRGRNLIDVWRANLAASAFDDKYVIPAWPETHSRPIDGIRPFVPVDQSPN